MGLALALIFWVVPPFCLRISFNLFFLACKKEIAVAVAGVRSLAVVAAFSLSLIQYIESAAVRQAKADARYIIYYIYNIYSDFAKVRKSPMYQGFSAFLPRFSPPIFRGCSARFSGVARPKFGGSPPKIRGAIS